MDQRYPALLPFALLVSASLAQTPFEHADQRTFQVGHSDCAAMTGGFAVAGWMSDDDASFSSSYVRGFDLEGNVLWEHGPQIEFAQLAEDVLDGFSDGTILLAGALFECDFFLPYFLAERIDATGSVQWSRTFASSYVNDADISAGDSIAFLTDLGILVVDEEGDSLTSFVTTDFYGSDIAWDEGTTFLTAGWSGPLARWALDGTLLASTTLVGNVTSLLTWQGHRLVLTDDGMLTTFTVDLEPVGDLFLGDGFNSGRLLPYGDQLLVVGQESTVILNASLNQTGVITMDPGGEFPGDVFSAFAVRDSSILMAGTATTAGRPAGLVRTIKLDGAHTAHSENVSIEIMSIDDTDHQLQWGLVYPIVDLTARITNLSSVALDKVMACHFGFSDFICGLHGTTVLIEDADLAPGASMQVPMTDLMLAPMPLEGFNPERPVCISALSPNDLYDRDQSNNYACDTAFIALGLAEEAVNDFGLVVGNPFANAIDMIFTVGLNKPLRAALFDATGRQIASTTIAAGSTSLHWELPTPDDGMHVLRVQGASTSTTRKLICQRP